MVNILQLFKALEFAADKHKLQKRKGGDSIPYINHPIGVTKLLIDSGETDNDLIIAAILHDTIEDTNTSPKEILRLFGEKILNIVLEVSDDKNLPKEIRKQLQVNHASSLSDSAKKLKLADKICNVIDIIQDAPTDWDINRKIEYLNWAEEVVNGIRGVNKKLEQMLDKVIISGKEQFITE